jgi:hypothetical protein
MMHVFTGNSVWRQVGRRELWALVLAVPAVGLFGCSQSDAGKVGSGSTPPRSETRSTVAADPTPGSAAGHTWPTVVIDGKNAFDGVKFDSTNANCTPKFGYLAMAFVGVVDGELVPAIQVGLGYSSPDSVATVGVFFSDGTKYEDNSEFDKIPEPIDNWYSFSGTVFDEQKGPHHLDLKIECANYSA